MNKLFPFADAPQQAIAAAFQTWMYQHPLVAWLLVHPWWSGLLLLVGIVLLRGLLGAIGRLTERIWLAILRAPMRLATWLFTSTTHLLTRSTSVATPQPAPPQHQRLVAVLTRLEAIQREQDDLLKELRELVGAESDQLTHHLMGENR